MKHDLRPRIAAETFTTKFALADHSPEKMQFRGMASVFGAPVDTFPPTVIMRGAFSKTLGEQGARVKILWQHDVTDPIGRPVSLKETDNGLDLHAQLDPVPNGQRAMLQIQSGTLTDLSIGFDPINWDMVPVSRLAKLGIDPKAMETYGLSQSDPVRALKEVRLWEASVVTFGAQRAATLTSFALAFRDLPLAAEGAWDRTAAAGRVREWAKGNFERLCRAYLVAGTDAASCRFQIADVANGRLVAIPDAIVAAAESVKAETLPERVSEYAREHLAAYFHKMGRLAPWEGSAMPETFKGRRLSKKSREYVGDVKKKIKDALDAISGFEGYADETEIIEAPDGTAEADLGVDATKAPAPAPDQPAVVANAQKPAETLRYKVEERDGKYCVVNTETGEVVKGGEHDDEEKAKAHMKALYANMPDMKEKDGTGPTETQALSDEARHEAIRAALQGILGDPWGPGAITWNVEATFSDSVIVCREGKRWRYAVSNDAGGGLVIGQPVEVKVEYLPTENAPGAAIGLKAGEPEQKIEPASAAEVLARTELRLKEMELVLGTGAIVT